MHKPILKKNYGTFTTSPMPRSSSLECIGQGSPFVFFPPISISHAPKKKKKKNKIEVYMISQNIISQNQSILPPMERWNRIHLPFWFAEFFSSERWRNKCIASFYETKSYYRLVTTSNQLIKTTTTLKKLKPCELFNHKVPIEFRT